MPDDGYERSNVLFCFQSVEVGLDRNFVPFTIGSHFVINIMFILETIRLISFF